MSHTKNNDMLRKLNGLIADKSEQQENCSFFLTFEDKVVNHLLNLTTGTTDK